jgi:hypothetical protein
MSMAEEQRHPGCGYDTCRAHFGQTAGSGSTVNGTVPEAAALELLLLTVAGMSVQRRSAALSVSKLDRD